MDVLMIAAIFWPSIIMILKPPNTTYWCGAVSHIVLEILEL